MKSDEQYLAEAGIDAETGGVPTTPDTASTPSEAAQAAPVEMFEVGAQRFPVNTEFKLTHDGKVQKVPYSTLANTYRQWSHLQNKWSQEYKPKIDEFEKLRPQFDELKSFKEKYGGIQEWSEKNPKEWEALWNLYQNKDKHLLEAQAQAPIQNAQVGAAPNTGPNMKPLIDEIASLKQELQGLKGFKETFEQKQQREQEEKDTAFVKNEVAVFQKEYPEINLEERDPDGVTLWGKIMKYGIDNHLPKFKTAALEYLESRLNDTWASRARNEAVKGLKTDRQLGIMKRSATPISGQGAAPTVDPKKLSLAQLAEYAKNNLQAFEA